MNSVVVLGKEEMDKFNLLYRDNQDWILRFCEQCLRCKEDAEEAANDIWIKVAQGLRNFKDESSITTWLWAIAKNHIKDIKKALGASQDALDYADSYDPETLRDVIDEAYQADNEDAIETHIRFEQLIADLPDRDRHAFNLYAEGYTRAEIAEALNMSIRALDKLFERSKRTIHKQQAVA